MCGACGRRTAVHACTPVLACTRARREGADPVDATLRDDGHPARVTATALWGTPLSHPEVLVDLLLALPARLDQPVAPSAPTPVVVAEAEAAAATARSTPSSRHPEPGRER